MATLGDTYFKLDTLKTMVKVLESKNQNGINLTLSVNDQTNEHGQNITMYVAQTKEEQQGKKPRFYVANGKVFWTDGIVKVAEKKVQQGIERNDDWAVNNDLPF